MLRDRFFAHDDPDGNGALVRVAAHDRHNIYRFVAENLAKISPPRGDMARLVHDGWVNSPGHYKNMVSEKSTHVGNGCAIAGEILMCTQVFGGDAGTLKEPVPVIVERGTRTAMIAQVTGLTHGGWALVDQHGREQAKGESATLQWPRKLRGEHQLRIIGKRREGNRVYFYRFFGPSVVLKP